MKVKRIGWVANPALLKGNDVDVVSLKGKKIGSLESGIRGEQIRFDYHNIQSGDFIEEVFQIWENNILVGHKVGGCYEKRGRVFIPQIQL